MTDNILLTFLFAVGFGAVCGLVNGVMVGRIEMPAFIVTLATMLMYRSFAQYFCQHVDKALIGNGSSVYKMANDKSSYQMLYNMGNGKAASIPYVGIVLIVLTVLFVFLTTSTIYGKKVYAVGSNLKGARMAGISMSGGKGKCLGILFGAMSYTVIDKIIVSLKMDSLINNAIKGMILLIVIMIQVAGPKIRGKLHK